MIRGIIAVSDVGGVLLCLINNHQNNNAAIVLSGQVSYVEFKYHLLANHETTEFHQQAETKF